MRDPMTLYVGATRYYLGRMTYAVGGMCDVLIEAWPELPSDVRAVIERDVEEAFALDDRQWAEDVNTSGRNRALGMNQDRKQWERVRALWRKA